MGSGNTISSLCLSNLGVGVTSCCENLLAYLTISSSVYLYNQHLYNQVPECRYLNLVLFFWLNLDLYTSMHITFIISTNNMFRVILVPSNNNLEEYWENCNKPNNIVMMLSYN